MSDESYTILVVDDNENNRDLIERRLLRKGYQVILAEDGFQALEHLRLSGELHSEPGPEIDLVILDVMMPGLSGIDVLSKVRKTYSSSQLPIIMATAKDQSQDMVEAFSHGANDYVTKPLDFPVIMARIEAQLSIRDGARLAARQAAATPAAEPERDPNDADFVGLVGAIRPGMVLGGKYRLEWEIGAGNFGAVYRASHLGFEHPVAVKILQAAVDDSPEALARFQQEGRSAFQLQHQNAVTVMDFAVTPAGLAYLVMELLEGHTLEDELRQWGQLSAKRAAQIVLPICEVLHEAHAIGIIHRDVKPANIFLHRAGARREEVVKVLDFGIAKLVGDSAMSQNLTIDEGILGTPAYMAPERLWGKPYDGRADAYSLGIMLYQMLAGQLPFVAEHNEAMAVAMMHVTHEPAPLEAHRTDLPVGLSDAVMEMLLKDHNRRPTVADLGHRIAEILDLPRPAALRSAEDVDPDDPVTSEITFAFDELLAPPKVKDPGPQQTGSGSVTLFPPDEVSDLWSRK